MSGRELDYVHEAFDSNYVAPAGPQIEKFESEFSDATGIPHCAALSSGTAAIHLALRCLNVSAGDAIWASTLTFIGSIAPAIYQGAIPVFFDCDASWTLDPALLNDYLSRAVQQGNLPKAVIPTDIYGQPCDLDAITAICDRYDVPVICDSAEAVGARYKDRHAGDGAWAAAFSFNGNKIITTSGGGMLASHDGSLIARVRYLAQAARQPVIHYEHTEVGYNYRLSNISAAIGRGQLEVLSARVERRREIFELYKQFLKDVPGISFMPEASYGRSTRWLTIVLIDKPELGVDRESVRLALERENIEARPVWKPMHMQPAFKDARCVGGAVSQHLFEQGLCLPSGTQMSDSDVSRVAAIIQRSAKHR